LQLGCDPDAVSHLQIGGYPHILAARIGGGFAGAQLGCFLNAQTRDYPGAYSDGTEGAQLGCFLKAQTRDYPGAYSDGTKGAQLGGSPDSGS